jgi:hypothetical protein
LPNAGGQQSICKCGRQLINFSLQMHSNIVSLFKRFGRRVFQNRTRQSSKTLAVIVETTKMTIDKNKIFEIISFTADSKFYYAASMDKASFMDENWVKHTDIEIDFGQSRYGGPVFDLPPNVQPPSGFLFAAQLDLSKFSPFDKSGLLPKTGQLIFFSSIRNAAGEIGKVIYADVPNDHLIRHVIEHEDDFFTGKLIDKIFADTETLQERYYVPEDEWGKQHLNEDGKNWGYFEGSERSKIFGILTHCQYDEEQILEQAFSNKTVLLQIGENGFNDEGVFSVLIDKDDLKNKRFDNCEFLWGQS